MEAHAWFISIGGSVEGPLLFEDLKKDLRVTPDTLVWRKGFKKWRLARDVKELSDLFKDDEEKKVKPEEEEKSKKYQFHDREIVMNMQKEEPPPLLKFWLLVFLISFIYIYFYFYNNY